MNDKEKKGGNTRRDFLKNLGTGFGAASVLGAGLLSTQDVKASSGKTIKVLTVDGRLAPGSI